MSVTFTNIVVGEGTLYVGANSGSAVDLGATQDGAEIAWEPDMVDIEVDQFGDAARVVQSRVKVSLKTKLAEGTLDNLLIAWNYPDSKLVAGVGTNTLSIGLQSVYPQERYLKLIGNAPGSTASNTYLRTYECNRVMSYSSSSHMVKRAENVAFPVDFRILPDPTQTGAEYGTIEDETA
jgi:hypothetical protein